MPVEVLHESDETAGLYCDGRECFEVLMRRRKRKTEVGYWCGFLHSRFDPCGVDESNCPRRSGFKLPKPRYSEVDARWSL